MNNNNAIKGRFDGLDVQAMVSYLQGWCAGRRVVNIYDGATGESYIFKLEKGEQSNSKEFLLLESGIRFHTISSFEADAMPTPFCAKLRKHLRGLRLESIAQIGSDRVVLFQFGAGPSKHSVILELYAKGNLILTDPDYRVLALLRSHIYTNNSNININSNSNSETKSNDLEVPVLTNGNSNSNTNSSNNSGNNSNADVAVRVGHVYPVSYATSLSTSVSTTTATPTAKTTKVTDTETSTLGLTKTATTMESAQEFNEWTARHIEAATATALSLTSAAGKKKKTKNSLTLKTLLAQNADSGVMQYGPALIEHCIRTAQLDPNTNLQQRSMTDWSEEEWKQLREALVTEGPRVLDCIQNGGDSSGPTSSGGYILYRPRDATSQQDQELPPIEVSPDALPHADKFLQEFLPVLLRQHDNRLFIAYNTFAAAVEDYFDHFSHQKTVSKAALAEKAAVARLEKIRIDQQERVDQLSLQQDTLKQQAAAVQFHSDNVDKALAVINSALVSGMDWDQLETVVSIEQMQNRNPIALLIHKLDLAHDAMILRLPAIANDDDDCGSGEVESFIDVLISLKDSAHANASHLFAKYRSSKEKSAKTIEASTKALKAAEDVAQRQLAEVQKRARQGGTAALGGKRKPAWFEKFHWFVTSENYLVLGGKDAHQNELLVKRYLRTGDAYLHADVHGAATCILRAKRRRRSNGIGTDVFPLSEHALREAGKFTICWSSAWKSRMVTSAWWVESHQVSKTAPTGEYLTVGSFMVRGKKSYLPPTPLEMGLAVIFRLGDDDSILRHKNERRDFALLEDLEDGTIDQRDYVSIVHPEPEPEPDEVLTDISTAVTFPSIPNENIVSSEDEKKPPDQKDDDALYYPKKDNASVTDQVNSDLRSDQGSPDTDNPPPKKRGLSVRDRKLIKKYGTLDAASKHAGVSCTEQQEAISERNVTEPFAEASTQASVKRGQKSKLKRVVKKYMDQDDDDRALAMLALQGSEKAKKTKSDRSRGKAKNAVSEHQQKAASDTITLLVKDSSVVAALLPDDVRLILAECVTVHSVNSENTAAVRWDKFDTDTLQQFSELCPVEAQIAAARRLLKLKETTRIDNFSSSLGGKSTCLS